MNKRMFNVIAISCIMMSIWIGVSASQSMSKGERRRNGN